MTQVIHGLTREQLVSMTFDPRERLRRVLVENQSNISINTDGRISVRPEAIKSAISNFGANASQLREQEERRVSAGHQPVKRG